MKINPITGLPDLAGGASTDEKVKVSSNDTTEGYLNGKLVAGDNIELNEQNNGSNETLEVRLQNSIAVSSVNINGTNGSGHIHLKHQATDPSSTASSTTVFADTSGNLALLNNGIAKATFATNGITDERTWTLPDASGTIALTSDLEIPPTAITFNLTLPQQNPTPATGPIIRFRALSNFIPQEWKISANNGTEIEFDVWRGSSNWPTFTSDSICNGNLPSLISGSDSASSSATDWDAIDKDDYLVIIVNSGSAIENKIVLQILGLVS